MSTRLDPPLSNDHGGPVPAQGQTCPAQPEPTPPPKAWMARWEADTFTPCGPLAVGGGLLRAQGAVARDLMRDRHGRLYCLGLLALALFASALYGAILGAFSGPQQMLFAAIKFPVVVLGACAICLPSFHVFNALMGARLNLMQSTNAVLLVAAAAGLILLACAPVVWFFSLSTEEGARGFMIGLHLLTLGVATAFGVNLIWRVQRYARFKDQASLMDGRVLALWLCVFLIVAAQLAHHLGPLVNPGDFFSGQRGFFVTALVRPD
ncbi:MAG: hypothetical protein KF754_09265 [Planctomycetes bacterium]|nr:hypothetical protein [Planctomycetota bacterium]